MEFRAKAAAAAALFLFFVLSASATFAQSVLTVNHALSILSDVRHASTLSVSSTPAPEKGNAPESTLPDRERGPEGAEKGTPESRRGLP